MIGFGSAFGGAVERRQGARIMLEVPAQLNKLAAEAGVVPAYVGQTVDLSLSGACVRVKAKGPIAPGEVLHVSIGIPWEYRNAFPFSRIVGSCRVARIEEAGGSGQPDEKAVALAFNADQMTFLGAIVAPPRV